MSSTYPSFWRRILICFERHWQRAALVSFLVVTAIGLLLVQPVQEALRHYLAELFIPMSCAPDNYSRIFVQAAIPAPEVVLAKKSVQQERQDETVAENKGMRSVLEERGLAAARIPQETDSETQTLSGRSIEVSAVYQPAAQGRVKAEAAGQPYLQDGARKQKSAVVARTPRSPNTERFPQYLLKPPYIYTVQVESFKKEEVAAARMRELRRRGFDAWIVWIDLREKGIWYRILVGKYKDKREAQRLARQLGSLREFPRARQIATHKESAAVQESYWDSS